MLRENLVRYLLDSIKLNWDCRALSDFNGESFSYEEIAAHIQRFHHFFQEAGVEPGDAVALLGKNSARWGIIYISVITYGAAIVPILPDFKPDDLHQIIDHSDAKLLLADESIAEKLVTSRLPRLGAIISISGFAVLHAPSVKASQAAGLLRQGDGQAGPDRESFNLAEIPNDRLAVISYTSGTTGFTKGVMLSHNNLAANIRFARANMPLKQGDRIVSFLPLAHAFGCAFEFLFPFTMGCDITILTKTPSPQVIISAFQQVRPALILTVPLVIEKIFRKQLLPVISKFHMRILLAIPGINKVIQSKIYDKLSAVFGGHFKELIIGGASLNAEAERFLRKIRFPFTVGYGMTECGPLISYVKWPDFKLTSAGRAVDTLELRIDSPDPKKISGEILVRGENVMMGYYKNEQATMEIIDGEGWLHTGDLGLIDDNGNVFIKGRIKSLILGPSGKNIYPEEIESLFNNQAAVSETLIVEREGKLVALIYPDQEEADKAGLTGSDLLKLYEHHLKTVNHHLPKHMNVNQVEIHPEEFMKTPKRSIKRFLYQ